MSVQKINGCPLEGSRGPTLTPRGTQPHWCPPPVMKELREGEAGASGLRGRERPCEGRVRPH